MATPLAFRALLHNLERIRFREHFPTQLMILAVQHIFLDTIEAKTLHTLLHHIHYIIQMWLLRI